MSSASLFSDLGLPSLDNNSMVRQMMNKKRLACRLLLACLIVGMFTFVFRMDIRSNTVLDGRETDFAQILQRINVLGRHSDYVLPPCRDATGTPLDRINTRYNFIGPFDYLPDYKNPCWRNKSEKLLCIPYFYLVGTVKSATTDLFNRILLHPQVARVWPLEKRWFDRVRFRGSQEKSKLSYYTNQFLKSTAEVETRVTDSGYHDKVFGDDSPSTLFGNNNWQFLPGNEWCQEPRVIALSHIHRLNPSAKLILTARNPTDRLYSDYLFNTRVTKGNATAEEFHERVSKTIDVFQNCLQRRPFRRCLYGPETFKESLIFSFTAGIYSRLILDTLQLFPREQLLVIQTEDYEMHLRERLEEVFHFLELDPLSPEKLGAIADRKHFNEGRRYRKSGPMLPDTRKMLNAFYGPFNEELAILLKDDKYLWKDELAAAANESNTVEGVTVN